MPIRSRRIPAEMSLNRLTEARRRLDEIPFDLTVSNPTACGFNYPEALLAGLGHPRGLIYSPDPGGPLPARRAAAETYERWGVRVDPDRVVLTTSTSEAYSSLFRLLCDPGDAVLFPSPSYPLFEQLARLDGIAPLFYELDPDGAWRIDFSTIERAPATVRAVTVVHPNNPTGSHVHPDDAARLIALCRDRGWALIADEVFLPYPLEPGPGAETTFAAVDGCLCFALGGLSKSAGLPQLKLAWIVVNGPRAAVREACEGLEWIGDAYLSVSTPVAMAAPEILSAADSPRRRISTRCRNNLGALRELAASYPAVSAAPVGGGWSAVIRIPAVADDEEICVRLLEEAGVALLPGFFFDFPRPGHLVASLLVREEVFRGGIEKALSLIERIGSNDLGASTD